MDQNATPVLWQTEPVFYDARRGLQQFRLNDQDYSLPYGSVRVKDGKASHQELQRAIQDI